MDRQFSQPPRTLIADDQPEVLEALRLLLKGEGFQPEVASSPAEIVESLRARRFDLLLMDLNYARDTTSGQEGLDLLREIQALDATLPVIVMTGWGSVELAVEVMRRGVRDFVQKPWDNDRLIAMLHTHVEQGRVARRAERLQSAASELAEAVAAVENVHVLLEVAAGHLARALDCSSLVVFTRARDHAFWAAAEVGCRDDVVGKLKLEPESRALQGLDSIVTLQECALSSDEAQRLGAAGCVLLAPVRLKGDPTARRSAASSWQRSTGSEPRSMGCACAGRRASTKRRARSSRGFFPRRSRRSTGTRSSGRGSRRAPWAATTSTSSDSAAGGWRSASPTWSGRGCPRRS
ncbi:MAG: hypothetical protein DMG07_25505 [Acidobacteria bacterium]|nr:MAG: hypothetical protein DMG07_25505 [Acidobacteriota bacterium]